MRRTKDSRPLSVGFISLGCAKNLVDSEMMASRLISSGFVFARAPEQADILVVNTCAFIHDARTESIDSILEACELKRKGRVMAVLVAGCLPQRYKRELVSALPEVDAFIGLDEIERVGDTALRLARGERRIADISKTSGAVIEPLPARILFTGGPYAYIKIAEGCDHSCSFCAIPGIRGRYRSRPVDKIRAEAEKLLSGGVRELNLIGQDVTSYGCDLGGGANLAGLLRDLGGIGGRFWIRILYAHPGGIGRELLETIASVPQVCHYLDIPVQHSHSAVLRAMGRTETGGMLRGLFGTVREILPDVTLRTTFLVGFPGETDKRFKNLLDFIKEIRFDHAGVFTFSREENTKAWKLRAPSRRLAEERKQCVLRTQAGLVRRRGRALIGLRDCILVEKRADDKPGLWIGRSRAMAPEVDGNVFLTERSGKISPGAFIEARYVSFRGYDMRAVTI